MDHDLERQARANLIRYFRQAATLIGGVLAAVLALFWLSEQVAATGVEALLWLLVVACLGAAFGTVFWTVREWRR